MARKTKRSNYLVGGEVPESAGAMRIRTSPNMYQSFTTSDGALVVAVGNDRQFAALCATLELRRIAHR